MSGGEGKKGVYYFGEEWGKVGTGQGVVFEEEEAKEIEVAPLVFFGSNVN